MGRVSRGKAAGVRPLNSVVRPHRERPPVHGMRTTMQVFGRSLQVKQLIIGVLAGLLIFYHTYTLYDLYLGSGTDLYEGGSTSTHALFVHAQSILRISIIASLLLVAMNRRFALYGMWVAISALVATHYWALFFELPFRFLDGRHPLSYLKGFIIPTVITILSLSISTNRSPAKVRPNTSFERTRKG